MLWLGEVVIGETVPLRVQFHDDTGTAADPTSPTARMETGAGTFANLATPDKRDSKTGYYGVDFDTTGLSAGFRTVRIAGTVATAKAVAAVYGFNLVAARASTVAAALGTPTGDSIADDIAGVGTAVASLPNDESILGDCVDAITNESEALGTAVWATTVRALTDKTDFALTSAYDPAKDDVLTVASALPDQDDVVAACGTAISTADLATATALGSPKGTSLSDDLAAVAARTDLIPDEPAAVGSAMTLDSGERDTLVAAVEAALLDEEDGQALLAAIVAKINATDVDLSGLSVVAIASAAATATAAAILATPENLLATDESGQVAAVLTSDYDHAKDDTLAAVGALNDLSAEAVNAEVDTAIGDAALATAASITGLHDFDPATDVVARVTLVDTTTDLTNAPDVDAAPTVEEIDTQLSTVHGSGAWGGVVTELLVPWDYTLLDGVGTPISGAKIWIATDHAGNNVIRGPVTTDAYGVARFWNLDPGTIYVFRVKDLWEFANPDTEVVS